MALLEQHCFTRSILVNNLVLEGARITADSFTSLVISSLSRNLFGSQNPMQLVAPSAVSTADAIDTTICAMNLMVSFLVMVNFVFS